MQYRYTMFSIYTPRQRAREQILDCRGKKLNFYSWGCSWLELIELLAQWSYEQIISAKMFNTVSHKVLFKI